MFYKFQLYNMQNDDLRCQKQKNIAPPLRPFFPTNPTPTVGGTPLLFFIKLRAKDAINDYLVRRGLTLDTFIQNLFN